MTDRRPRYEEIAAYLRGLVADAEPGDRLPSDSELASRFEVSRMTARHAVQVLANEQLLHREQGRGTFVSARPVPQLLGTALSFTESMRVRGLAATSKVLEAKEINPSDEDLKALRCSADDMVAVLERLRLADGVPMAIERAVLAPPVRGVIASIGTGSLHQQFEALGRFPTWARARVQARNAEPRERRLLELGSRGVVLHEHRIIHDQNDEPLEHTDTWYAAERYVFDAVLTGSPRT